jgi:hypothetical protein
MSDAAAREAAKAFHRAKAFRRLTQRSVRSGGDMNKRLLSAAICVALCVLAAPASARPHVNDDDDESRTTRQRHYDPDRSYGRDDDDDERSYRRERRQRQRAARERSRAQAARKASRQQVAKPLQVVALPTLQLLALAPSPQATQPPPQRHARNDGRDCLKPAARTLLDRIEAQFGPMHLVSTCRPGARIAGSGRISKHASGEAIDFEAGRRKGEVVRWLIANHRSGGTMTYADMSHIHVDVGQHFVALNSGGGR